MKTFRKRMAALTVIFAAAVVMAGCASKPKQLTEVQDLHGLD